MFVRANEFGEETFAIIGYGKHEWYHKEDANNKIVEVRYEHRLFLDLWFCTLSLKWESKIVGDIKRYSKVSYNEKVADTGFFGRGLSDLKEND